MSSARSAIRARMVTRSGSTSAKPKAIERNTFSCPLRYQSSPTASAASSGVWPGSTPKYPSAPGISTSSTCSWTMRRSGVTIWRSMCAGSAIGLRAFHLVGLLDCLFDRPDHVERLLRQMVPLAGDNLLEAADGVGNRHVLPGQPGELLADEKWLRHEALDAPGAADGQLVFFRQLVDAEDRDDVLQVLVALQDLLDLAGDIVMLVADNPGIEDARRGRERIDRRVDAQRDNRPRQVRRRIEVRKRRRWRRVGIVVGGNVDRLDRSDRPLLRRRDPLLQLAHLRQEPRLVAAGRRHAAEERRHLGARLREAEDVVDEEQDVLVLRVTEVLGDRQAAERHPQPRTGRLRHLAVDERRAGLRQVLRVDDAALLELEPEIVPL